MATLHELIAEVSPEELLGAIGELYHHVLGYVRSMALKCAVDLGIPDAVNRRGGAATLADIATDTGVHPSKLADLRRMMELLSTTGMIFDSSTAGDGGDVVYRLTTVGRFIAGPSNFSPVVQFAVSPLIVSSFFSLPGWFRSEPGASRSLFDMAHGCSMWEMASKNPAQNSVINNAMVVNCQTYLELVVAVQGHVFHGLSSLVDVGGGHGTSMEVISREFPHIKCSVLDLPHVISQAPAGNGKVQFIAGDMFKSIPPADAVVLKNILHDWSDDDCVKILQRCKEAIPARKDGGKVEAIQDMLLMFLNGKERDEQEWKMIFSAAGFSNDYKILPVLGPLSIIEIYPCNQCQRQLPGNSSGRPGSASATSTTDYRHRL
ncbi:acetylserotonin O-methyltransferase 1-like [Oryza glaberrima]|uniref:acetylserotonin O-methyltransferase 1-like n=1 Tax=Oryza glaberrima TaxID=4538 RepID=UPI00224C0D8D|nr:acetylserotonin O-methyltransferase 1-like [Oryza glaberrima]